MAVKGVNYRISATNAAGPAMQQFQNQLGGIQRATQRMAPTNASWNRGLSENRRAIQQLGFQMTDFTVQIAGGQNAMLAFIQQGGQMLQVFGPMGAILATMLTVFGTLALVMIKSGKSLAELTPIVGVLTDELAFLVSVFRMVTTGLVEGINLILNHLDVLLIAVGIVAGRWVASWLLATNAVRGFILTLAMVGPMQTMVFALASAFAALRAVLMTVLPYAILLAVSYLIERFLALKAAAGSWGETMKRLGAFVSAVFSAMGSVAQAMGWVVEAVFNNIAAAAGDAIFWIADKWNGLMEFMSSGFNTIMEAVGSPIRMTVDPPDWYKNGKAGIEKFRERSEYAFKAAGVYGADAASTIGAAWDALAAGINDNPVDVRDWFGAGDTGKDGGGGGTNKLKKDAEEIKKIYDDLSKTISDSMLSGFKSVLNGTKSLKDAAIEMLNTILDKVLDILLTPIFDNIAGSLAKGIGSLFGFKSFDGGGYTGSGSRTGGMDGKGGFMAMLHPNETVIDHTRGGRSGGGGGGVVRVMIEEAPGFATRVRTEAQGVAISTMQAGLAEYDSKVLPSSMARVSGDPDKR